MILACAILLLAVGFLHPVSSLSCYDCQSTFPGSAICLPACSQTTQVDSTCLLTRNIALEPTSIGSVRAAHISDEPIIEDATEKSFLFGQEAVYQNSAPGVGWDWEYGPITYGCDTPGCNDPQNVNRLPNALNARIPNATLDQLLTGDVDSSCFSCNLCVNDDVPSTDMSECGYTPCPQHSCNLVATRVATTGPVQCDGGWHFTSGCIQSREPAQVEMTLMHYIRSKTTVIYQMEAICNSDNCNNLTTFKGLKEALKVDPDLTCLSLSNTTTTTSSSSSSSSSSTTSGTATTTTTRVTGSTTTSSGSSTTSGSGGSTTTTTVTSGPQTTSGPGSSAVRVATSTLLFVVALASFHAIEV